MVHPLTTCVLWLACIRLTVSATPYCSRTFPQASCVPCADDPKATFRCPQQCGNGRDLHVCDTACSDRCRGSICDFRSERLACSNGCRDGFTGSYCQEYCPDGCMSCGQEDSRCDACVPGRYGEWCEKTCANCRNDTCDKETGRCTAGCKHRFYGDSCYKSCSTGCKPCLESDPDCVSCYPENGLCKYGCKSGFYESRCEKQCLNCKPCNSSDPNCHACTIDGKCNNGCKDGYYGTHCESPCPDHCTSCHHMTGTCSTCTDKWAGANCSSVCPHCRSVNCDTRGLCVTKCVAGFHGDMCQTPVPVAAAQTSEGETKGPDVAETEGSLSSLFEEQDYLLPLIGGVIVVAVIIAVIIYCRCRGKKEKDEEIPDEENPTKCPQSSVHSRMELSTFGRTYDDIDGDDLISLKDELQHMQLPPSCPRLPVPPEGATGGVAAAIKRNKSAGTLSMVSYMSPISEEINEEEEEEEEGEDEDERRLVEGNTKKGAGRVTCVPSATHTCVAGGAGHVCGGGDGERDADACAAAAAAVCHAPCAVHGSVQSSNDIGERPVVIFTLSPPSDDSSDGEPECHAPDVPASPADTTVHSHTNGHRAQQPTHPHTNGHQDHLPAISELNSSLPFKQKHSRPKSKLPVLMKRINGKAVGRKVGTNGCVSPSELEPMLSPGGRGEGEDAAVQDSRQDDGIVLHLAARKS